MKLKTVIRIGLSALYLGCLFHMPYNYYQLVRFISLVGFGYLFYTEFVAKRYLIATLCFVVVAIYNPITPLSFEREIWQKIDIILALTLVGWVISEINFKK